MGKHTQGVEAIRVSKKVQTTVDMNASVVRDRTAVQFAW